MNTLQEAQIKTILLQLEESVEKDKLNESELLHVALETWENIHHTSHAWGISPGLLLRAAAVSLFGYWVLSLDWKQIWKKIKEFSIDKIKKLLKAAQLVHASDSAAMAIDALKSKLGLNVQPNLERAMAVLA